MVRRVRPGGGEATVSEENSPSKAAMRENKERTAKNPDLNTLYDTDPRKESSTQKELVMSRASLILEIPSSPGGDILHGLFVRCN